MVTLIDILVQNFTIFFFGFTWAYFGFTKEFWVALRRSVIQGRNNYYNSNFLSKKPFSLLNIVSDIAMGLDVERFSSPRPYLSWPCRAYHIRLYMRL